MFISAFGWIGAHSYAAYLFWPFHASHIECGIHGRVHLKCTNQEHSLLIWFICICCRRLLHVVVACKRLFVVGMFTVYTGERIKCRHAYRNRKKTTKFYIVLLFSMLLSLASYFFFFSQCLYVNWHICSVYEFHPGGICLAWCCLNTCSKHCNHCLSAALLVTYSKW